MIRSCRKRDLVKFDTDKLVIKGDIMGLTSFDSVKAAVNAIFGADVQITGSIPVSGGDINRASCLSLSSGKKVFIKSNSVSNMSFFDAEEAGLDAIAATHAISTPSLLCKGIDSKDNISFLMMEMIDSSSPVKDYWEVFGRELAHMHLADTEDIAPGIRYGFTSDNFIGATGQINTPCDSWTDFFRIRRLEPQFKMAERYFDNTFMKDILKLLDRTDELITEPERPSLLHGDLWSGNIMTGNDGKAMLIDPASYIGNAEADIAMTELFGRLPGRFYSSYNEINPIKPGYEDRRELYNLYHLLNHLNLFGSGYLMSVIHTVKRYI